MSGDLLYAGRVWWSCKEGTRQVRGALKNLAGQRSLVLSGLVSRANTESRYLQVHAQRPLPDGEFRYGGIRVSHAQPRTMRRFLVDYRRLFQF